MAIGMVNVGVRMRLLKQCKMVRVRMCIKSAYVSLMFVPDAV